MRVAHIGAIWAAPHPAHAVEASTDMVFFPGAPVERFSSERPHFVPENAAERDCFPIDILLGSYTAAKREVVIYHDQIRTLAPRIGAPASAIEEIVRLHEFAHGLVHLGTDSKDARQFTADGPGVRLVNLWSAVECLLGSQSDESIIERVTALVAPITVWRRAEKVVRYLAISLHHFRREYRVALPAEAGFENCGGHSVACEDLLHVLAKPDGHSHPPALAAFASRHTLLRYRLFRAWRSLSVSTELRHELAASVKRVRWQLFRIYRARNLTVHHGDDR